MNVGTGARTAAMSAFFAFSKEKIFPKFLLNLFLSKHLLKAVCRANFAFPQKTKCRSTSLWISWYIVGQSLKVISPLIRSTKAMVPFGSVN